MLFKGESSLASVYIESGMWSVMWYRLMQMLRISETEAKDAELSSSVPSPDWMLLSFEGFLAALDLGIAVFSRVGYSLVPGLFLH